MQPVGQPSHQRLLAHLAWPHTGQAAPRAGAAAAAPVLAAAPSTPAATQEGLRVPQQVLRKRDFESELLDRLLNGAAVQPPPPPAPPGARPAPLSRRRHVLVPLCARQGRARLCTELGVLDCRRCRVTLADPLADWQLPNL